MKVVVFGAGGMLGKEIVRALRGSGYEWTAYGHSAVDILDITKLNEVKEREHPQQVINCAGDPNGDDLVNSIGPHRIARVFNHTRIIHISTDCVFGQGAGDVRLHSTDDIPNPDSPYGISKLMGESGLQNVVNIRTSFIGTDHGLLRWLINNRGKSIAGWSEAWWSGSTARMVATAIVRHLPDYDLDNIEHLALKKPINKYDLLCMLNVALGLDCKIAKNDQVYINRALEPTIELPDINVAIAEMAQSLFVGSRRD